MLILYIKKNKDWCDHGVYERHMCESSACQRQACEARGQNWSETKVIIGLDPLTSEQSISFWHTDTAQRGSRVIIHPLCQNISDKALYIAF